MGMTVPASKVVGITELLHVRSQYSAWHTAGARYSVVATVLCVSVRVLLSDCLISACVTVSQSRM